MKISIKKIISNKRLFVVGTFVVFILLLTILNITFSAFTNRESKNISNIKVAGMVYSVSINGTQTTMITAINNKTTNSNVMINSLNNIDSKYELIYKVCTDINCNNAIDKPEGLSIAYSSRTIDPVFGSVNKKASKSIRIISINDTDQTYYIKLDLNAGYIHNTLALKNLIVDEYNEDDVIIAATINGEISTTFPNSNDYSAKVTCSTDNGTSNASGIATWNGSKWIINITGVDSGRTICNIEFNEPSLRDKILAQGGGELAIEDKANPDFNKIVPSVLNYSESTDTYTYALSSNGNRRIGTDYIFNESTGRYALTNYVSNVSYGEQYIGHYTCNSTSSSNCTTIFKINEVSGTSITKRIRYRATKNYNYSDTGLYAMEDEYGTSYYYRGDKEILNNNIIWGGFQWKIIRINGDGSVKLIYNGTEPQFNENNSINNIGENTQIGNFPWNETYYDDAKYVGFMYGGANGVASTQRNGTTYRAATYNSISNSIKKELDDWYKTNIVNNELKELIVDNIFCNDRQLQSEVGGAVTGPGYGSTGTTTHYAPHYRIRTILNPSLKCGLKNDRFTVTDKSKGNGILTYPVGLITADEAVIAGLVWDTENFLNYLITDNNFWTMSPNLVDTGAGVFKVHYAGMLDSYVVYFDFGLRPVLSIKGDIKVIGTGSSTDPFKAT